MNHRFLLTAIPREMQTFYNEFRAEDRRIYPYQAAFIPNSEYTPHTGVTLGATTPHNVFVSQERKSLEELAKVLAKTYPNIYWCLSETSQMTLGKIDNITVTTKTITEKGMLP